MTAARLIPLSPLEKLENHRENLVRSRLYLANHTCPMVDGCYTCVRQRSSQHWYAEEITQLERTLGLSSMTADEERILQARILAKREDEQKKFDDQLHRQSNAR